MGMDGNPTTFSQAANIEGNETGTGYVVNDDVFKDDNVENQDLYVVPMNVGGGVVTRKYSDSDSVGVYDHRSNAVTAGKLQSDAGSNQGIPTDDVKEDEDDDDSDEDNDQLYRKDRSTKKEE